MPEAAGSPAPGGRPTAEKGGSVLEEVSATAGSWLDEVALREVLAAAARAPSMLNSQPWRFAVDERGIEVRVDESRRLPVADPSGWAARMACGAALFNLRIALAVRGLPGHVHLLPDPARPHLIAHVTPDRPRPATPAEVRLYHAIGRRRTNRFPFAEKPVPVAVRTLLIDAARAEGGWLDLVLGPSGVDLVAQLARVADDELRRDGAYLAETRSWGRDGLAADGIPADAGGPAPQAFELLARRDFGGQVGGPQEYERDPVVAVLGVGGDAPADQVLAGQVLQRVLLTATDLGLACSMLSQPIEVAAVREQLRLALGRSAPPQLMLRFGYAVAAPPTGRRPVEELLA